MSFPDPDKLRAAMLRLEKFGRDPRQKRSLGVKRSYRRRRKKLEAQLSAEEQQALTAKTIAELEELRKKGKIATVSCSVCGDLFEVDLDNILYLSKFFQANPRDFMICARCRSRKGIKRRVKRKIRKGSQMTIM